MKKILKNSLYAICIILYLLILSFAYTRMNIERLSEDIRVFSGMFLVLGLLSLERAYKNENGNTAITAIELLVLSFYSLSIMHMTALIKCEFIPYVLISTGVIGCYYILKVIVSYTKQRREYLKGLSDISEIVKKDEPIKKEAKKRSEQKVQIKNETNKKEEKETKKNTSKKKTPTKKSTSKGKTKKEETKKTTTKTTKKTTTKKKTTKKEVSKND